MRAVRLANPKSITIAAHTWYNDDMYQDDAHDGALCVSRVYPNLLLNVSYPVSAKVLARFLHAANVLAGRSVFPLAQLRNGLGSI